jgi:eukaryotic-like serine/threonine-protein kinase
VWSPTLIGIVMPPETPKYRRFGPYVLLQRTGAGGMGHVDVALSTRAQGTERLCVVKRTQRHLRSDEQDARFRREAGIAIGLSHGAIAQTLDVEEIDGELCILQEYIHGTTLGYLETRAASHQPLPISLSLHVVHEVARALAYAHSLPGHGIVHRDVTPDNIMLSFTGEVKLIDFGIAKVVGDSSLTQARMVVGRPIYTAPEAVAGGQADHRCDIYSLGVVLWMLLTERYFPDIFEQGPAPAPSSLNPAVNAELDALCLKAIEIDPKDRWQSAEDLLDAIALVPGVVPTHDRKIAAFLAKYFDVEEERRQLARDIVEARGLLVEQADVPVIATAPAVAPPIAERSVEPRRHSFAPAVASGLVLGAAAAALVSWTVWLRAARPLLAAPTCAATAPPSAATVPQPSPELIPPPEREVASTALPAGASPSVPGDRRPSRRSSRKVAPLAAEPTAAELLRDASSELKVGAFDRAFALAHEAAQQGAGAPAHLIMGKVFFAKSDLSRAEAEFRTVAALRPDDPEAPRFLDVIRKQASGGP